MGMRNLAAQYRYDLHCHRNAPQSKATRRYSLQQAVNHFDNPDLCRAVLRWMTKLGPFWEDLQEHPSLGTLLCNGQNVTDSAVGKAACIMERGLASAVVSIYPSSWCQSPLEVNNKRSHEAVFVQNYWNIDELRRILEESPLQLDSWDDLKIAAKRQFSSLIFATDAFDSLQSQPFAYGAALRLLERMKILEDLKNAFDEQGRRTREGKRILREFFSGGKAWFSDSSTTEKRQFRKELTFRHPKRKAERVFCTWHGKVKTPQLRFHFTWPIRANEPTCVVYVGPKITKG